MINVSASNNQDGINLCYSTNTTMINVSASNNQVAINLCYSTNTTMINDVSNIQLEWNTRDLLY